MTKRQLAIVLAIFAGGCGGSHSAGPIDAAVSPAIDAAAAIDAAVAPDAPGVSAACEKIATPAGTISAIPGMYMGDLSKETNALDLAGVGCTHVSSATGVSFPGPDQVVELDNLTPGTDYAVRVDADFDAALYVVTGCDGSGLRRDQCLDAVNRAGPPTAGDPTPTEAGLIAPPSGTAYVVIDSADATAPKSGGYTVRVYEPGCRSSFDCDASAPVCAAFQCVAGESDCTSDDASENADDGPSGAVDVTPASSGTPSTTRGKICSLPAAEADWYKFTVTTAPATAEVDLDASTMAIGGDTLEVHVDVFDSAGRAVGASYYNRPNRVSLTYLPADTYYVEVTQVAPAGAADAEPYTLSLSLQQGTAGCGSVADCAATYNNQNFRGDCAGDGSCQFIDGKGMVSLGKLCDSDDDCDPTKADVCTGALRFVADADTGGFCSVHCVSDNDCQSALGSAGDKCTSGFPEGDICLKACKSDQDCPVDFRTSGNWKHTTCDSGGHCVAM